MRIYEAFKLNVDSFVILWLSIRHPSPSTIIIMSCIFHVFGRRLQLSLSCHHSRLITINWNVFYLSFLIFMLDLSGEIIILMYSRLSFRSRKEITSGVNKTKFGICEPHDTNRGIPLTNITTGCWQDAIYHESFNRRRDSALVIERPLGLSAAMHQQRWEWFISSKTSLTYVPPVSLIQYARFSFAELSQICSDNMRNAISRLQEVPGDVITDIFTTDMAASDSDVTERCHHLEADVG